MYSHTKPYFSHMLSLLWLDDYSKIITKWAKKQLQCSQVCLFVFELHYICINEKCTFFCLCCWLICWQGGQQYSGLGFPLLLHPQFWTREPWRWFSLCHRSIPCFPNYCLWKGSQRQIGVGVASPLLHCHRSLPCFIVTHFQCDIWFSLLAEQIYAALYAMLVLLQNKQSKPTMDFLKNIYIILTHWIRICATWMELVNNFVICQNLW